MYGEAGGPIVNNDYIFDIPPLQQLYQVLHLKLPIGMWCAAFPRDYIVEVLLILVQQLDYGARVFVEASSEKDDLKILLELRQHLE
jgi:hypothetical protein